MADVVISGLGFITSVGQTTTEVAASLRELRHGLAVNPDFVEAGGPATVTGHIPGFAFPGEDPEDWSWPETYRIRREQLRGLPPHGVYAHCALAQAIEDAGLEPEAISDPRTGMFTASAGSARLLHRHLGRMENLGIMRCSPMSVVSSIAGTLSFNLVAAWKIQGASTGFVSACASSGHALGYAFDEIALGRQERMLVVAAEDGNLETILPFAAMRALSTDTDPGRASRPFDATRNGFVGTGGACVVVLESAEAAQARGARNCYARLRGWGQGSDGHSVAISHPEGNGLVRAVEAALASARIRPGGIGYINAHAASTPIGDLSEARALAKVFGGAHPAVSSTKALTGHGLSLSSALEAGICALCLREGITPGSAHIEELDPRIAELGLNIIHDSREAPPGTTLSTSSGFGGANVALILDKP